MSMEESAYLIFRMESKRYLAKSIRFLVKIKIIIANKSLQV